MSTQTTGSIDPIELLRRQYLQCLDPESLTLPKPELLRLPDIQDQIYHGMFDEKRLKYPPPIRYSFRVLKRIVAAMEEAIEDPEEDVCKYLHRDTAHFMSLFCDQEISNDISECMAQYMTQPLPPAITAAQQRSYVTYTVPSFDPYPQSVTIMEARALLASSGTTGFRTWEAALHLASFLFSVVGNHYIRGKSVLELGAGTGFLSVLCAAHLGANHVLATDGNIAIVDDIRTNIELNGLRENEHIKASVLLWEHALIGGVADCRKEGQVYDLIIGADVTYDVQSIPALVATLRDLFEIYPKTKVLISATVRNEDTLAAFLKACDANQFKRETLALNVQEAEQVGLFHPTAPRIDIFLITLNGKVKDPFSLA